MRNKTNEVLQWSGTVSILVMYTVMNYFRELHPVDTIAGLVGGLCYFTWSMRVANKPQMIVNAVAITVCVGGLFKAWS